MKPPPLPYIYFDKQKKKYVLLILIHINISYLNDLIVEVLLQVFPWRSKIISILDKGDHINTLSELGNKTNLRMRSLSSVFFLKSMKIFFLI